MAALPLLLNRRRRILLGAAGFCLLVVAADWQTRSIVFGVLLTLPIMLASFSDERSDIGSIFLLSVAGWLGAALWGERPLLPPSVYIANRMIVVAAMLIAYVVADWIRRLRIQLARERDRALDSSELNRLLISLVAHDLRSPLALAGQTLQYVQASLDRQEPPDRDLMRDVSRRLGRSMDAAERLVRLAQRELENSAVMEGGRDLAVLPDELASEVAAFQPEATSAEKSLMLDATAARCECRVNVLVLKHLLGVLLDNAILHAAPGRIEILAAVRGDRLELTVSDEGRGVEPASRFGLGRGLELAERIARRAGGSLERHDHGNGSSYCIMLPVRDLVPLETASAPPPPALTGAPV